jgi:hypothetical protein
MHVLVLSYCTRSIPTQSSSVAKPQHLRAAGKIGRCESERLLSFLQIRVKSSCVCACVRACVREPGWAVWLAIAVPLLVLGEARSADFLQNCLNLGRQIRAVAPHSILQFRHHPFQTADLLSILHTHELKFLDLCALIECKSIAVREDVLHIIGDLDDIAQLCCALSVLLLPGVALPPQEC